MCRVIPALVLTILAAGCAHNRDQYAYAPTQAPPVYSQPAGYSQPVNQAPMAMPAPVEAGSPLPPGGIVNGVHPDASLVGMPLEGPCPPGMTVGMTDGGMITEGEMISYQGMVPMAGDSQSPPCPQLPGQ